MCLPDSHLLPTGHLSLNLRSVGSICSTSSRGIAFPGSSTMQAVSRKAQSMLMKENCVMSVSPMVSTFTLHESHARRRDVWSARSSREPGAALVARTCTWWSRKRQLRRRKRRVRREGQFVLIEVKTSDRFHTTVICQWDRKREKSDCPLAGLDPRPFSPCHC
jgi:hypothetical protein